MTDGHMQTTLRKAFSSPAKPAKRRSKLSPVSVRFTADERAQIEREAGEKSLSQHIRQRLFGANAKRRSSRREPVKDHAALARCLSALGRSNLSRDLDALSWSVREGTVLLSTESEAALRQACSDIADMRKDLVKALGLKPE